MCCTEAPVEQLAVAAAPEPRELTQTEREKVHKQREAILRELRVFLRDLTNKLLAERKFKEFTKPVDPEEVKNGIISYIFVTGLSGHAKNNHLSTNYT